MGNATRCVRNEILSHCGDEEINLSQWQPGKWCEGYFKRLHDKLCEFGLVSDDGHPNQYEMIDFILARAKERGVAVDRNSISNWGDYSFSRDLTRTADKVSSRRNMYGVCGALGLNMDQTGEVFRTVFLTRPFNVRDAFELLCYYFAAETPDSGEWYLKAESEYQEIKDALRKDLSPLDSAETAGTASIMASLEVVDKDCLKSYILDHRNLFNAAETGTVARRYIKETLLPTVRELAAVDLALYSPDDPNRPTNRREANIGGDTLIAIIAGINFRADNKKFHLDLSDYPDDLLPRYIRQNFPTGKILDNIVSGKPASQDKIRKALLLLLFYDYFSPLEIADFLQEADVSAFEEDLPSLPPRVKAFRKNRPRTDTYFESFEVEANQTLEACCFPQLYYRSPYDFLLLHCAACERPLGAFRTLMKTAREQALNNKTK